VSAKGAVDPAALASLASHLPTLVGAVKARFDMLGAAAKDVGAFPTTVDPTVEAANAPPKRFAICLARAQSAVGQAVDSVQSAGEGGVEVLAAVGAD
jgi:hypothetical protein